MRKPSRWLRSWPGLWLTVVPRWKPSLLSAIETTLPSGQSLCMWLCFWSSLYFSVIYLTQNIFCPSSVSYMTSKVQPSASTKRKYRSVVLQRPRALHLQQLSQGETSIDQLRRHYWESLHRWTTLLHPTFRRERLRLSNGRGRVDGGPRMTKSNCPFLPSLSLKSSLFRIPTLPLSLVLNC